MTLKNKISNKRNINGFSKNSYHESNATSPRSSHSNFNSNVINNPDGIKSMFMQRFGQFSDLRKSNDNYPVKYSTNETENLNSNDSEILENNLKSNNSDNSLDNINKKYSLDLNKNNETNNKSKDHDL